MDHWTAQDWVVFMGALSAFVAAVFAAWAKFRGDVNSHKIDQNTDLTRATGAAATNNAAIAATAATDAKDAALDINKKLNGGIDSAIRDGIAPIHAALAAHAEQDEKNLAEINTRFKVLTEYVHERNHDIIDAINAQSLKLERVLRVIDPTGTK